MRFDVEFTGAEALLAKIERLRNELARVVGGAVYQHGEMVMAISKTRVPVDTGALMSTGFVSLPEYNGNEVTVGLSYGGPSVGYALQVHEDLTNRRWRRPGSGPKYLENPLKETADQLLPRIGNDISDLLNAA